MATKFGSFLKKSVPYVYLGGGACAGLAILYPHTLGLEHYKNLMAIQTPEGKEELVDVEILNMAEEIKRGYGWDKRALESTETISLFATSSLEISHLGTAKTKWGSHLGIPKYYLSQYRQDEKHLNEVFKLLDIDPSSEAAINIRQSFNISDAAKTYAVAREMKLCKSYQVFFITAGAQVAIGSLYLIPNIASSFLPFPGVKFLSFLALFPLMYFGVVNFLKSSSRFSQKSADKAAASLSFEIASGGLEYYNSMITRQKALSNTSTEDVKSKDFVLEMLKQSWNDSFMTLEERKANLEVLFETMYKNKESALPE